MMVGPLVGFMSSGPWVDQSKEAHLMAGSSPTPSPDFLGLDGLAFPCAPMARIINALVGIMVAPRQLLWSWVFRSWVSWSSDLICFMVEGLRVSGLSSGVWVLMVFSEHLSLWGHVHMRTSRRSDWQLQAGDFMLDSAGVCLLGPILYTYMV